ncbi:MAG TPA: hypothetical protein VLK23_05880, partial [Thermodesulfobacteriota bacterium]|nr:hypothetical protein [Thermodesulfobacteriota bacterium]
LDSSSKGVCTVSARLVDTNRIRITDPIHNPKNPIRRYILPSHSYFLYSGILSVINNPVIMLKRIAGDVNKVKSVFSSI